MSDERHQALLLAARAVCRAFSDCSGIVFRLGDETSPFRRLEAEMERLRREVASMSTRTDGAAVECPKCGAKFGGMTVCPWDGATLRPLPDADPTAVAFYAAIGDDE